MQEELARERAAQSKPWRPKQPRNRKAKFCGLVVSYMYCWYQRERTAVSQYTITVFMLHVRLDSKY